MSGLHIIWFRDDLRVHDHAALRAACQAAQRSGEQVMALYVLPAEAQPGSFHTHQASRFLFEALADLRAALAQRDTHLHLRHGDILDILSGLHAQHGVLSIDLHERYSSGIEDPQIEAWCLRAGVRYGLHRQFHPGLALQSTESWQTVWERFMARPRYEAPDDISSANVGIGPWPNIDMAAPTGGRKFAIQALRRVLGNQTDDAGSLPTGAETFAALVPHLRLGAISMREVWQAVVSAHQQALKAGLDIRAASLASFLKLLPSILEAQNARSDKKRYPSRRARSARHTAQGHQYSLGLDDSGA